MNYSDFVCLGQLLLVNAMKIKTNRATSEMDISPISQCLAFLVSQFQKNKQKNYYKQKNLD